QVSSAGKVCVACSSLKCLPRNNKVCSAVLRRSRRRYLASVSRNPGGERLETGLENKCPRKTALRLGWGRAVRLRTRKVERPSQGNYMPLCSKTNDSLL